MAIPSTTKETQVTTLDGCAAECFSKSTAFSARDGSAHSWIGIMEPVTEVLAFNSF
jgi:hypothetical protein